MQKDLIYIDIGTKSQIDSSGEAIKNTADYVTVERGQWQVLCFNFVRKTTDEYGVVTLAPQDLTGCTYLFVADNNFDDEDSLMLKSYQTATPFDELDPASNRINIEGDWIDGTTADLSQGQLSVRVNSDTVKFAEAIGETQASVSSGLYMCIKQYVVGLSTPSSIMWTRFTAKNTIRDWNETQENPPSGEQVVAYLNTYFQRPIEREWSLNGVSEWQSVYFEGAKYYRERIQGVGAEWGATVPIIKGEPGAYIQPTNITDTTSTTATIASLAENVRYVYTQPLTSLTISAVPDSAQETEIQFTAGTGITVSLPADVGMMPLGGATFVEGASYIINFRNKIAVVASYTPGV